MGINVQDQPTVTPQHYENLEINISGIDQNFPHLEDLKKCSLGSQFFPRSHRGENEVSQSLHVQFETTEKAQINTYPIQNLSSLTAQFPGFQFYCK